MSDWYFLLTPLAVLAVLLLFRFIGCSSFGASDDAAIETKPGPTPTADPVPDYPGTVLKDNPVSYWRLQEKHSAEPSPGATANNTPVTGGQAKDEKGNNPGTYKAVKVQPPAPPPPPPPAPNLTDSPPAPGTITLESTGLLELPGAQSTSLFVDGGYVEVPFSNSLLLNSFTFEALVRPEWDPNDPKESGRYRTVIAHNALDVPAPPATPKLFGFGLFAGPVPGTAGGFPVWQIWLADGTKFTPIKDPIRDFTPVDFSTVNYLAVTYDAPSKKLNMYVYVRGINLDSGVAHPVNDVTADFSPAVGKSLLIGMHRPPAPSAIPLYHPFKGRIQEVAIYNTAMPIGRCPGARICAGMHL
jgi:hypothetical protein